jgi:hypothetical protein
MITHIGTVAVYVTDQHEALTFWTEQVGFELKSERPMTESIRWLEVGPIAGGDGAHPVPRRRSWRTGRNASRASCSSSTTSKKPATD